MRGTRAFTLLELIVTLVITGILFSIGAFSYEFVQRAADKGAAENALNNVLTTQVATGFDFGFYTLYADELAPTGGGVTIVEAGLPVTEMGEVSMAVSAENFLGLATLEDETCLALTAFPINEPTEIEWFTLDGECSGLAALQQRNPAVELRPYEPGGSSFL